MSAALSINQLINRLKKLNETFNYVGSSVLLKPVQQVEADMKERIFLKGKRPSGNKIGNYAEPKGDTPSWADIRKARGLQIEFIDLKFTGDLRESIRSTYTGDLFKSKSAVIYINDDEIFEKKYDAWKEVFTLSVDELSDLYLYVEYYLNANIEKTLTA